MNEIGLDVSGGRSTDVMEFLGKVHIGYVITVCSNAEERCPIFPFSTQRLHWPFEDPAAFEGTDDEKLAKFREVRDLIDQRIRAWLREQGIQPAALPAYAAVLIRLLTSNADKIAAACCVHAPNSIGNWTAIRD